MTCYTINGLKYFLLQLKDYTMEASCWPKGGNGDYKLKKCYDLYPWAYL